MSDIGSGDKLECIKEDEIFGVFVRVGTTYTCSAIYRPSSWRTQQATCPNCNQTCSQGILLAEVQVREGGAWCPCSFRKIGPGRDLSLWLTTGGQYDNKRVKEPA